MRACNILRLGVAIAATLAIRAEEMNPFQLAYNNFDQCQRNPSQFVPCVKLKALKLVDRALNIDNLPILEGVSLTKKESNGSRSLSEEEQKLEFIDDNALMEQNAAKRDEKLNSMLWDRVAMFLKTRSVQFKADKLFSYFQGEDDNDLGADGRKKKDKKGMMMYLMMMKGGMLALAYKALAALAFKALLVSKIALTLALLVAVKKLFSSGGSHQKTTYEIVKTPIVTHSHQYSGGGGGHAADFTSYGDGGSEGGPYARNFQEPTLHSPKQYLARVTKVEEARGLSARGRSLQSYDLNAEGTAEDDAKMAKAKTTEGLNLPEKELQSEGPVAAVHYGKAAYFKTEAA